MNSGWSGLSSLPRSSDPSLSIAEPSQRFDAAIRRRQMPNPMYPRKSVLPEAATSNDGIVVAAYLAN